MIRTPAPPGRLSFRTSLLFFVLFAPLSVLSELELSAALALVLPPPIEKSLLLFSDLPLTG